MRLHWSISCEQNRSGEVATAYRSRVMEGSQNRRDINGLVKRRSPAHQHKIALRYAGGCTKENREMRYAANEWCERGDSIPHGFTRQSLSMVRLPIPPLSHREHLLSW